MSEAALSCELSPAEIGFPIEPERFGFATTAEVEPLAEIVGQPRALEALDLGIGIRHRDYHVFAAGMTGTSKLELLRQAVQERVAGGTYFVRLKAGGKISKLYLDELPRDKWFEIRLKNDAANTQLERAAESLLRGLRFAAFLAGHTNPEPDVHQLPFGKCRAIPVHDLAVQLVGIAPALVLEHQASEP